VILDNLVVFFDSEQFWDAFSLAATKSIVNGDTTSYCVDVTSIVDIIWQDKKVVRSIFGVEKTTSKKYNVEMLWLSLIVNRIVVFDIQHNGLALFCIGRVSQPGMQMILNVINSTTFGMAFTHEHRRNHLKGEPRILRVLLMENRIKLLPLLPNLLEQSLQQIMGMKVYFELPC
jgi:hypothetical protein